MGGLLVAGVAQNHASIVEGVQIAFLSSVPAHSLHLVKRDTRRSRPEPLGRSVAIAGGRPDGLDFTISQVGWGAGRILVRVRP